MHNKSLHETVKISKDNSKIRIENKEIHSSCTNKITTETINIINFRSGG